MKPAAPTAAQAAAAAGAGAYHHRTTSIVTREADLFCYNHHHHRCAPAAPLFDSSCFPPSFLLGNVAFSDFIVDLPSEPVPALRIATTPFPRASASASAAKRKPLELLQDSNRKAGARYPIKESAEQTTKRKRDLQAQAPSLSFKRPRPIPSSALLFSDTTTTTTTTSFSSSSSSSTMALNPHKQNKVDVSSLTEEEQKLFRLYGKLPNKKDLFSKKLQERKYFDSGDYAMSKAGKSDGASLGGGLGREHPTPENIPHLSQQQSAGTPTGENGPRGSIVGGPILHPATSSGNGQTAGSPVKEASLLHRGSSVDEQDLPEEVEQAQGSENSETSGIPIRQ